jgi:hypothetical protein
MEDFDDFDCDGDDFSDDFGDYDSDGDFYDDGLNEETQEDSEQEDNGIGWEEIAIIGGMVEEFSEEKERRRLEKKRDADRDRRNSHS